MDEPGCWTPSPVHRVLVPPQLSRGRHRVASGPCGMGPFPCTTFMATLVYPRLLIWSPRVTFTSPPHPPRPCLHLVTMQLPCFCSIFATFLNLPPIHGWHGTVDWTSPCMVGESCCHLLCCTLGPLLTSSHSLGAEWVCGDVSTGHVTP